MRRPSDVAGASRWVLSFTWLGIVCAFYYRRAWALLLAGPRGWDLHAAWALSAPPLLVACCVGAGAAAVWTVRRGRVWNRAALRGSVAFWSLLALLLPAGVVTLVWPQRLPLEIPSALQAAGRAVVSIAAAALVLFDGHVAGGFVLRLLRWKEDGWQERVLFRLAIGLGALSFLLFALALAGVYRAGVVVALLAVIAVAGVLHRAKALCHSTIGVFHRSRARSRWRADSHVAQDFSPATHNASALRYGFVLISGVAVAIALVGALAPEIEYDALWYHLWLPKVWLLQGRPVDIPTEYVSLYPMTWELLYGAALAAAGPVAAKLIHLSCLPLLGLAVWQFMRRFFPDRSPWFAVAATLTCPTLLWEATTAYIDLALALYVTLGLYALLASIDLTQAMKNEPPIPHRGPFNAWFALAALCFGLGAATKHLGLIVAAIVALGLFIDRRTRRAAALGFIALLVPFPWYLRAWLASGNPFFPELYKVFGAQPGFRWDAVSEHGLDLFKAQFGMARTPLNLALLPWNVTVHGAFFRGCLGPIFLVALPALILWRTPTNAYRWLVVVVAAYVAVWASPVSSFQLRFLVPLVPALAILSAVALQRLLDAFPPRASRFAGLALLCVLALNLPPFIPLHEGDRRSWNGWLSHVIRRVPVRVIAGGRPQDEYLRQALPTYGAWTYVAGHRARAARVLEFGGGDNFYASADRISMDAPVARGAWASGENAFGQVEQSLHRLSVTDVLFDKRVMRQLEQEGVTIASPAFRSRMRLEYEDERAVLYRGQ